MSTSITTQIQAPPGGDLRYVNLDFIVLSTTNPRKQFDGPEFDELVESVRRHGVLQPVLLRPYPARSNPDVMELIAGERRFRAAAKCGISALPAYVRDLSDAEAMELQIVENLQRQDVSPLEEASGYLALVERMEQDAETNDSRSRADIIADIAEKVGKSERYVYARIKLNSLAPKVKDAIASGRIPVSHGDELVRLPVDEQAEVMEELCFEPTYDGTGGKEAVPVRALKEELRYRDEATKRKAEQKEQRAKAKEECKSLPVPAENKKAAPKQLTWQEDKALRDRVEEDERPLRELVEEDERPLRKLVVDKMVDQVKEFGAREIRFLVEHVGSLAWFGETSERICKRFQWKPVSEKTIRTELAKLSPTSKTYTQAVVLAALAEHLRPNIWKPSRLERERAELIADAKLFGVNDVQKLIDAHDAALKVKKAEAKKAAKPAPKATPKKAVAVPAKKSAKKAVKKAGRK